MGIFSVEPAVGRMELTTGAVIGIFSERPGSLSELTTGAVKEAYDGRVPAGYVASTLPAVTTQPVADTPPTPPAQDIPAFPPGNMDD